MVNDDGCGRQTGDASQLWVAPRWFIWDIHDHRAVRNQSDRLDDYSSDFPPSFWISIGFRHCRRTVEDPAEDPDDRVCNRVLDCSLDAKANR
jgi:hypothetical protein